MTALSNNGIPETMTYGGGIGAVAANALSWGDAAALIGATAAVLGLCLQAWATLRRDRRELEAHEKRMQDGERF